MTQLLEKRHRVDSRVSAEQSDPPKVKLCCVSTKPTKNWYEQVFSWKRCRKTVIAVQPVMDRQSRLIGYLRSLTTCNKASGAGV